MDKLKRNKRVRLFDMGNYHFEVRSKEDDVLKDSDDNYFIYMSAVNFIGGNIIEGRYLGDLSDNSPLIDPYCKEVKLNDGKYMVDGQQIRVARMVAVNNKTNVIVVIQK